MEKVDVMWNTISTSHNVNVKKACRFFKWLAKIFSPMTRIEIGSQQVSPMPCFILAYIAPGWVGGILSCATIKTIVLNGINKVLK